MYYSGWWFWRPYLPSHHGGEQAAAHLSMTSRCLLPADYPDVGQYSRYFDHQPPASSTRFESLQGDGSQWGLNLQYKVQQRSAELVQALIMGKALIPV